MKNVTLAIDDQTYRAARIVAAEQGKSLSALVREFLQSLQPARDTHGENVQRMFAAMDKVKAKFSASDRLPREQLHERRRVR